MDCTKRLIEKRGKFLVVDGESNVMMLRRVKNRHDPLLIVDLENQVKKFLALAGNKTLFTALDLQTVSGLTYRQVSHWIAVGIIPDASLRRGNERLWRIEDAYLVGLLATLRRHGQGLPVLTAVSRLFGIASPVKSSVEAN